MNEGDIRFLSTVYALQAEVEALKIQAMGMHSENESRFQRGESIAYPVQCFDDCASDIRAIADKLRNL